MSLACFVSERSCVLQSCIARRLICRLISCRPLQHSIVSWYRMHCCLDVVYRRNTSNVPISGAARRGKGEASPLWVDVQKLCNMCVLSLSWNFFVSHDKYIARPSSKEPPWYTDNTTGTGGLRTLDPYRPIPHFPVTKSLRRHWYPLTDANVPSAYVLLLNARRADRIRIVACT